MDYSVAWAPFELILEYFFIGAVIAALLLVASKENPEAYSNVGVLTDERTSMYECGFEPFSEPQEIFFIPYFSVAILFLVFDLELVYLFPWVLNPDFGILRNLLVVSSFLIFIAVGLLFEWRANSLNFFKTSGLVL